MRYTSSLAAVAALVFGAIQAQSQSVVYNFTDGTSDGWANAGFSGSPLASVVAIGGVNYIALPLGGFQVANISAGADGSDFYNAMQAAAANPAGYNISYTYSVNTAGVSGATFLQFGTFVNTGSGYYAQDYGSPNELSLDGTAMASGQTFTGTISVNLAAVGYVMPPGDTFFRLGFIENGNGTGVAVDVTGISVAPIATPEPATLALGALGAGSLLLFRRRKA